MNTLNWAHALPLIFMAVMGLALLVYVILDGYDLGVGILLPYASDTEKDVMVSSIGPFWDANETWLVLGVGMLLVCFPMAHGVVLSALYLPVALMLVGLILRGTAFDFRVKARDTHKTTWNRLFAAGSLLASLAQGWMLGAYITGFQNDAWSLLFSAGIALTLPAAYAMLGVGWLIMKTEGSLQRKAARWGRRVLWPMGFALTGISLASPLVSQTVSAKWFMLPELFALLPIALACATAFFAIRHVLRAPHVLEAGYGWIVFVATVAIFVLAFFGLAYSIYPYIVIDRITVWQAASATESLAVIGVGVAITLPVIIAYTIYMYRVFWGKARALTYGL
ncbi:cytochrome d ubiquinol oxidase subunit II [Verminephrobacter aporrectodeae subsp. tuberculatae]|uniref:Cytochrome d ubiquinol oxidase subunit II n=1 Tax=Verminephrobacter aporrectodeae subsp. tuberculatae TaxID=1110392 RepID=A0ABT3KWJ8_9BURK|nr:cytochrome d ubiquinol oxidase subunit II [Verminephrobacter aporrectodeae]MCW5223122.1 cytochrome d ubiquinol oxidase subunit II [Verminephrobacter aporrectodeae subsp. tuberculatae]MCW5288586.1 cytochrome d ubiquinol oxidase subunit II [Verminephrobacter aporrectodeae subsp. tuberculatae]MCW5322175.1 cytochrome d ubiquinol oxidase subunit II [Verminephrobacter aporrectodeae subsp. tuberculatae]MCW8164499.1 cytochrome d ubiquinol oxidase subunit II [Verminephrobacter aporrectodeae subsp. tu